MTTIVVPKIGFYVVSTLSADGLQTEQVTKQKTCTCGGSGEQPCPHIRAVAAYLKLGGPQAPAEDSPEVTADELPDRCPICDGPVIPQAGHWRCVASPAHYWRWRGEQFGVKAFLTQTHPAKQGAFYDQSPEEREAFLAAAHRRLYSRDYSPYR